MPEKHGLVRKDVEMQKKYYVRVRAYTTKSGKKVYGPWFAKKSVKINM